MDMFRLRCSTCRWPIIDGEDFTTIPGTYGTEYHHVVCKTKLPYGYEKYEQEQLWLEELIDSVHKLLGYVAWKSNRAGGYSCITCGGNGNHPKSISHSKNCAWANTRLILKRRNEYSKGDSHD